MSTTVISLIALAVSIAAFLMSAYKIVADRKIQIERIHTEMRVRLTARGVEILALIEQLRQKDAFQQELELVQKLIDISAGLVYCRETIQSMNIPSLLSLVFITSVIEMRGDLEVMETIFEELKEELKQNIADEDFTRAKRTAQGLLQCLYGTKVTAGSQEAKEFVNNIVERKKGTNPN